MVDALEAVIGYLYADADLNVLTGGRIAAKHKFGDGWVIPVKALQVRPMNNVPPMKAEVASMSS